MRRTRLALTAAVVGCLPLVTLGGPDPKLVSGCEDCHGANGITSAQDVPTIAHVSASVQSDALKAYKGKARPCPKVNYKRGDTKREGDMCSVAQDLGDAQITGTIKGAKVSFDFSVQENKIHYEGTLNAAGTQMEGTCDYGGLGSGTFKATKSESKK